MLILLGLSVVAWAQSVSTSLMKGTIEDSTGSAVPGAQVRATQTETGAVRTVISGPDGAYVLSELPVGPYQLEVSKDGFSKYVQTGIVLQVASNPTIDISLKVGAVTEQIRVEANATMVETQNSGVGTVIDSQRVVDLPLVGRQVQDLITLAGGATSSSDAGQLSARNYPNIQSFSVAGGLANGITYVLDGATHQDVYTMANMPLPFPDALQEFKVETGALPAQYGMHSAAAVNAVTKSGTNDFHGTAFEFLRNYSVNARSYFSSTLDSLKRNQFGGTFGGPIKKNKLFFFGAYQQTDTRQSPSGTVAFVPTAAELQGDFSVYNSLTCQGKVAALKDPLTGAALVNNRIPVGELSTPALNIAKFLPTSADPCGRTTYGAPVGDNEHFGVGKVDYQLTPSHSIFVRYLATEDLQPTPYDLAGGLKGGGNLLATGNGPACVCQSSTNGFDDFDQALSIGDTYLVGNATVNSFRATFTRAAITKTGPSFFGPQDVGINAYSGIPDFLNISIPNVFTVGNSLSAAGKLRTTFLHFSDDVGIVRGSHQFAFGASIGGWDSNVNGNVFAIGNYTFTGQITGLAMADFLTGRVGTFNQAAPNAQYERDKIFGLYGQDSWRIKPGLTLNYGLRWEPFFPLTVDNGQISTFLMPAFLAGQSSTVFKGAPPGLFFPGDPGFPGQKGMNNQWKQFMPRIGVVWDPTGSGKMSIRASYGIFYDRMPTEYHLNTTTAAPFGARTTLSNVSLANPWANVPGGNPFPYVLDPNHPFFNQFSTFNSFPYDNKMPYVQSWTFSIQRQFGKDWLATVSYLGNEITHMIGSRGINPGTLIPGAPIVSSCPATSVTQNCVTNLNVRRLLYRTNPATGQFFGSITQADYGGTGSYNGLMTSLQKRYSKGVTLSGNYTWSHCISNPVNDIPNADNIVYLFPGRARDRGNCNLSGTDRRHIANLTAVGEMPKFSDKWTNLLISGWRASATATMQSGSFVTIYAGTDQALTGYNASTSQRANQILANTSALPGASTIGVAVPWINPAAFASPALGTNGNAGMGIVEGPGLLVFNLGLSRLFSVREHHTLELRAEAQNVLNHTNLGNPVSTVNSPTFGQIVTTAAGQAGNARVMQFGLKYVF